MTIKTYSSSCDWQMAVVALSLALLFGLVASLGSPQLALFLAALVMAVVLAASPLALLWLVVVGGLIFAGVAELYLPAVKQARWGVVIASLGLGTIALLTRVWTPKKRDASRPQPWSPVATWGAIFIVIALLSGFMNLGMTLDAAAGFKNYFQVWSILLAFTLLPLRTIAAERFMAFLVWLGLLQFPFILHQYFILVPQRLGIADAAKGIVAEDVLVGTFSGSVTGGGAGPAMAILLLIALVICIARWRSGMMSLLPLASVTVIFLVPPAIGEDKIVLVLLPVGLALVFQDKIRRSPVRAMALLTACACLLLAMFAVFTMLPRSGGTHSLTLDEYWRESWSYNLGDRGYGNNILNRTTVYPFWVKYQRSSSGSVVNALIGYGPGATNGSSLTEHSLSRDQFPKYGIGLTGLSALLWDVGVLGTVAALGFFLSAFRLARRLVHQATPYTLRWAHLKGAEAGVAMAGLSLLHNNMFLFEIGFQTIVMLLVGYLTYVARSYGAPQNPAGGAPDE